MSELSTSHNHEPQGPSSGVEMILLEAAQFYLLADPSAGTIHELTPLDADGFRRDVRNIWQQRTGSHDEAQFDIDFAEIERRIAEDGAEALILQQKTQRAEARSAASGTASQLGLSGIGRLLRRKR